MNADGLRISEVHHASEIEWIDWRDLNWLQADWKRVPQIERNRIHAAFLSGYARGRDAELVVAEPTEEAES